jgi:glycosyltransferase involved in cell wall biosynthesis
MSLQKLMIIDDNPDFGGHQVMAAHALEGLVQVEQWDILVLLNPENAKNWTRLQAILPGSGSACRLEPAPTRTAKFQAIKRYFERGRIRKLASRIAAFQPDLILVIQGNIEQTCSVFKLQGSLPCPLVSYLPVPHHHAEMGAKLGALRDLTCRGLYGVPDGFITISKTLGEMLVTNGATGRIQIVENGIPLDPFKDLPTRVEARAQFNLPQSAFLWGQIGRVEFKQKGQDFALELFLARSASYPEEHLVFLGSGPDGSELEARAAAHPNVHCLPWTDNPAPLYAALDALLMPSRYEGVPLTMLEALANALPVAATDRDGMRDWLPTDWRFPYRDLAAGLRVMDSIRGADSLQIAALKSRVWEHHTITSFQQDFNRALAAWL